VVGTAKNCRLLNSDIKNNKDEFDLGCSMGGAVLYPYISYLAEQTKKRRLNRLYFVMRDGLVLKQLFDIINTQENLQVETKLLYGSREAWRAPSITIDNPDISFMFASPRDVNSIEQMSARFHIKSEELKKFLPDEFHKKGQIFSREQLNEIKSILAENHEFIKFLDMKLTDERELVKAYIKQEIDLSDNRFALVDMAASGRTQNCLISIINSIKNIKITGFYAQFNLLKMNYTNFETAAFFTTLQVKSWLELFCRALCGYTICYKKENGVIVPVLEELEGEALKKYGYQAVIEGEKSFCAGFLDILKRNKFVNINLKLFLFYLDYLRGNPDKKTADLIGDIPFQNYYDSSNKVYLCAPKLSLKEVLFGYNETQIQLPNITAIRSSKLVNFLIKHRSLRRFIQKFNITKRIGK
jgi:predicted HAD superfamily hydrolase